TDTRTGEDQAVLEGVDPLDAVAADLGTEEVVLEVPRGVGEVAVLEPAAGLEDRHPVALLREPESADRSAETRADDHDVVVERRVPSGGRGSLLPGGRARAPGGRAWAP